MFTTKLAPALMRADLDQPVEAGLIEDLSAPDPELDFHGGSSSHRHDGPGGYADPSANQICGTRNDDYIDGTEKRDVIDAKRGDDTVYGHDGNDTAFGREGADYLNGGKGDDLLWGGQDNDTLVGGEGNDSLSGGSGNDNLYAGGDGWQNILNGGPGTDRLHGSEYVGVRDVFQFTLASDSVSHPNTDTILGFRTNEDKIHLAFDSDEFKPGHQTDFHFVDKEDAGTAGTMWVEGFYTDFGTGVSFTSFFRLYGHTNNDGIPDFEIKFEDNFNDNEDDWWQVVRTPDELIDINDFIF